MDLDATHDTPCVCAHCGHVMTNSSGHDVGPEPGDFTLCIRCAGLNVFGKDLALRKPTRREARDATSNDEVQDFRAAILCVQAKAKRIN